MTCPSCSSEVPASARFCPTCGHPLHAPADERRVVTVLFGDIVGFTGLSERRDPEQVKNLIDRCFAALAADIRAFGGSLDKVVGDGLVALFGAPVAHEDDAERAVRAALQMQRTIADMAGTLAADVRMRIGVNTGEVLVGGLRAGGDYTAMGDVVNTASRLQTLAEPGAVVVGHETWVATAEVFRYEPLGLLQARGREEAVEAWTAVEALLEPGRRPTRGVLTPLVGRDREVQLLRPLLDLAVTNRRPTMVLLLGEAGIGKSRLAHHVVRHLADHHGARTISGRAVPYGAANAWWPIAEVMREACGVRSDDSPDEVRDKTERAVAAAVGADRGEEERERIVQALLYLIGIGSTLTEVEAKRAQEEVARAVRTFLEGMAAIQPLVLTIGDIQWADPLILESLPSLLDRAHRLPLIVLLTARPELAWRPVTGLGNLAIVHLDPLDDAAAGELLTSLLGHDPGPVARAELVERSGGNPLFVEELAAFLAESTDHAVGALPATLRGIVAARLDSLPPAERAVLDDAAVVGRKAPMAAVLALGRSRGDLSEAIAELAARDLLVVEDGQCEFRSDLVREVVYSMLTKAERARRHAALAQWLERLRGTAPGDEMLGELARHWATAAELVEELGGVDGVPDDVREQAVATLTEAAGLAEDRELHLVAGRLFDRLVRLLPPTPSGARRHALVGRARASTAQRHDQEALADITAAEDEARAEGDDVALARALTVRGDVLRNLGDYHGSLAVLEEAREVWRKVGNRAGEGSALRRIGWTRLFAADLEGAEPVMQEALEIFREVGSPRGQAWALQNLAWAAFGNGAMEDAEARLHESIQLFRQTGDWGGLNWATGMLGRVRLAQGAVEEAEQCAERTIAEAREQGDQWQLGMMAVLLASIRLWQGRIEEAAASSREAEQVFAAIGDELARSQTTVPLTRALVLAGRFDEVERLRAEVAAHAASRPDHPIHLLLPRLTAALLAVGTGNGAEALTYLEHDLPEPGDTSYWTADVLSVRGMALLQAGHTGEAVDLLTRTLQTFDDLGPRSQVLAALALALGADGRAQDGAAAASAVLREGAAYSDLVLAGCALACAPVALGDSVGALGALARVDDLVRAVGDPLSTALAAMARARVLDVLGDPSAPEAAADAASRLSGLGVTAPGWELAFCLAAGGATAASGAAGAE